MSISRFRLILVFIGLCLAGLVFWFKVIPFGHISYTIDYPQRNSIFAGKGFIAKLSPKDRVDVSGESPAIINVDPVYFSIFTPRTFDEVKLHIIYRAELDQSIPVIETGVLVDNVVWRYKMQAMENYFLEYLSQSKAVISDGEFALLQNELKFSDIASFRQELVNNSQDICPLITNCLALYNYNDYIKIPEPKYSNFKEINLPMRGTEQFYFVIKKGMPKNFSFSITDLNLNKDSDDIIVSVYRKNEKIYTQEFKDLRKQAEASGEESQFMTDFSLPDDFEAGLYKLEVKANDDIVINKVLSAPSALNIVGRVRVHNLDSSAFKIWTDSSFIKLSTINPASLQEFSFGRARYNLNETYKQFEFLAPEKGLNEIILTKGDFILEIGGVASFDQDSFYNPDFKQINRHFSEDDYNIPYILAKYQSPDKLEDNWREAVVTINTKEAYREKGKYSFIISIPGLTAKDQKYLEIKEIKAEFIGRTIFTKVKEIISAYVN